MQETQSPQEFFRLILLTVVGQAFDAASYRLQERPVTWAGGLFRFVKPLDEAVEAMIEFQMLAYGDMPSRFQVTLARVVRGAATDPRAARRTLAALVVEDFGIAILPSADHWWTYKTVAELGAALAEAGSLAVGYGMPWLSGELKPPA